MLTRVLAISILAFAPLVFSADSAATQVRITDPVSNKTISGETIEIKGTGADPRGKLKVEVLTNEWWLQDGEARINPDGSWSYGPCHLGGKGQYNNHTIRVTVIKNGQAVSSDSVAGLRRAE